jgi:hypothetical protein
MSFGRCLLTSRGIPETPNRKLEIRKWMLEPRKWKLEIRKWKLETGRRPALTLREMTALDFSGPSHLFLTVKAAHICQAGV